MPRCVHRPKPNTHSGGSRTAIPEQAEHPFQAKANTRYGSSGTEPESRMVARSFFSLADMPAAKEFPAVRL